MLGGLLDLYGFWFGVGVGDGDGVVLVFVFVFMFEFAGWNITLFFHQSTTLTIVQHSPLLLVQSFLKNLQY